MIRKHIKFLYSLSKIMLLICFAITNVHASPQPLTVATKVTGGCTLTTNPLIFTAASAIDIATNGVVGTTNISVSCVPGVNFALGLDSGGAACNTPGSTDRVLTGVQNSAHKLNYSLWQDSTRAEGWGCNTIYGYVASASGNSIAIYAYVPPGQTVALDSYSNIVQIVLVTE